MMLFGPAERGDLKRPATTNRCPSFLLSRIRDLNQQLTDLRRSESTWLPRRTRLEQAAADRTKKFEDAEQQARNDLAAEREKFTKDLADVRKQKDDVAAQMTDKDNRIVELNTQLEDEKKAYEKELSDLQKRVQDQKTQLANFKSETFEVPDAVVTTVNQKEGVLYIDVGSADNLRPQQTFSVFDKGTTAIMKAKPKGRIEVMQILGEHVAMCRILEDTLSNIIMPGDVVFTPAWSPGQRIHFAIAGLVDITGNKKNDMELLQNLISINGGVLDDEVTVQTRYLIQGENVGEGPDGPSNADKADFTKKITAATEIGVDRLSVEKLLNLMGWRAEVKSITLGRGTGDFEAAPEAPRNLRTRPKPPQGFANARRHVVTAALSNELRAGSATSRSLANSWSFRRAN